MAGRVLAIFLGALVALANVLPAMAQAASPSYAENLATCLDGDYHFLCRHGLLTPEDAKRVQEAEYRANLNTCLTGNYRSLCRHGLLTSEDAARVQEAEYQANLSTCLDGNYPSLCRHGILQPEDAERVRAAEYRANLSMCLDGNYPSLCRRNQLSTDDRARVTAAEQAAREVNARTYQAPTADSTDTYQPGCAENGSCYGDISEATGRPKTVRVQGYYRRDGTYVRGHYRSKPRR